MNRRQLLTLLTLSVTPLPCAAGNAPPPEPTEPTDLYEEATRLLIRGRRFERAAEMLAKATAKEPDDYRYPAARGCALVSRAASLAYAAAFAEQLAQEHTNYPKELAAWQKAQTDPESDEYGDPMPQHPPVRSFPIKDDGQPYRLTKEQVRKRIAELVAAGRVAFEEGEKRAKTPEEKADAAYLHGWGLHLQLTLNQLPEVLTVVAADESEDTSQPPLIPAPKVEDIAAAFSRARDLQPENPLYWRAIGDTLIGEEREAAYRRAAELTPRDSRLWYHLFNLEATKGFGDSSDAPNPDQKRADPDKTLFYIRQAQKADPSNAWLFYEEAGLHFRRTKHSLFTAPPTVPTPAEQQANRDRFYHTLTETDSRNAGAQGLAAALRGNAAVNCFPPLYEPTVPKLLVAAWEYIGWERKLATPMLWFARFRELARALSGYALFLAGEDRNGMEAEKACRATIAIGQRLEGDWPVRDTGPGDTSVIGVLVGHAIVAIGYKMLVAVEQMTGTPDRAMAAQAEYTAFQERVKAHKEQLNRAIQETQVVDYY